MKYLFLFCTCLVVAHAFAQKTDTPPQTVQELLPRIEAVMQREHIPGLMLAIVTKDSILFAGGLGEANLGTRQPVNGQTLFRVRSVTKMFTAMGILKLIHAGKLNLNDALKKIAPEVPFRNSWEATHPVRVVHLLEHTAGFDDLHLNNVYTTSSRDLHGIDALKVYETSLYSRWKPGERMSYSNPDYQVVGYLIEKFSGKPWETYVQENVLQPLGMTHSNFTRRITDTSRHARGYHWEGDHYEPFPFYVSQGNGADGTLNSCANDMALFLRCYLNDWRIDSTQWLPTSYLTEMETVHSTLAARNGLQTGYGLGNSKPPVHPKVHFRGHGGQGEGFNTMLLYERSQGIGYAVSNNGGKDVWQIYRLIEDFLTQRIPEQVSKKLDAEALAPYLGYYRYTNPRSEMIGFPRRVFDAVKISRAGDYLLVGSLFGSRADTLVRVKNLVFRNKFQPQPSFVLGKDGEGHPFFQGYMDRYYQKSSLFSVLLPQVFGYLGLLAMGLSLVLALVWLVMALFRRLTCPDLLMRILPALAVISVLCSFYVMRTADEKQRLVLASINATSLGIYLGTLLFGVFSGLALWTLYRRWPLLSSPWLKGLLTFQAVFIAGMVTWLFLNGWIGVWVWAL
jgi:CubicO group peptidase (beta-lactamase class C family)